MMNLLRGTLTFYGMTDLRVRARNLQMRSFLGFRGVVISLKTDGKIELTSRMTGETETLAMDEIFSRKQLSENIY